jgi:hypothetical protein
LHHTNTLINLGFGAGTLSWTATTDQSGIAMNANRSGFSYTSLQRQARRDVEGANFPPSWSTASSVSQVYFTLE